MIDKLTSYYAYLDDLKKKYTICEDIHMNHWLLINDDDHVIDGELVSFAISNIDNTNIEVSCVFKFSGIKPLKEGRHFWFGPEEKGYLFYPCFDAISKSFEYLKTYFDGE